MDGIKYIIEIKLGIIPQWSETKDHADFNLQPNKHIRYEQTHGQRIRNWQ